MQPYFETELLWEGVRRITMPGSVYCYLVEGPDCAVLIDTGYGLGDFRAYVEELLQGKPYEVILTHGHVDHAGGVSAFDRVWMDERDLPLAAKHTQIAVRATHLRSGQGPIAPPAFSDDELCPPKTEGYLPLQRGQVFDLGTERLEIVPLYGHTKGAVGVLFCKARTLLSGDACCSMTLLFDSDTSLNVSGLQASMQAAAEYCEGKVDQMLFSHPHNRGGVSLLKEMAVLCGEILAGRDARLENRGSFLAKAMGPDLMPTDGTYANLIYPAEALES